MRKKSVIVLYLMALSFVVNAQVYTLQAGSYSLMGSVEGAEGAAYTKYLLGDAAKDAEIVPEGGQYKIWFRNLSLDDVWVKVSQLQRASRATGMWWLINDMDMLYRRVVAKSQSTVIPTAVETIEALPVIEPVAVVEITDTTLATQDNLNPVINDFNLVTNTVKQPVVDVTVTNRNNSNYITREELVSIQTEIDAFKVAMAESSNNNAMANEAIRKLQKDIDDLKMASVIKPDSKLYVTREELDKVLRELRLAKLDTILSKK